MRLSFENKAPICTFMFVWFLIRGVESDLISVKSVLCKTLQFVLNKMVRWRVGNNWVMSSLSNLWHEQVVLLSSSHLLIPTSFVFVLFWFVSYKKCPRKCRKLHEYYYGYLPDSSFLFLFFYKMLDLEVGY